MKVQSTGLGKTVMVAQFKELLKTDFDNQQVLQLTMEATEPLHWTIKVYMEPKDLRKAIVMGLKPSVLWRALLAVFYGKFSLFRKLEFDSTSTAAAANAQAVTSADSSTEKKNRETREPLTNRKESAADSKSLSPLSKLKE